MKKKLSVIYQFFVSIKIRNPYIDTILVSIFFTVIHLYIISDVLHFFFKIKGFMGVISTLGVSALIAMGILVFYSKRKLLQIHYSKVELKRQIKRLAYYLFFILLISMILQSFDYSA